MSEVEPGIIRSERMATIQFFILILYRPIIIVQALKDKKTTVEILLMVDDRDAMRNCFELMSNNDLSVDIIADAE